MQHELSKTMRVLLLHLPLDQSQPKMQTAIVYECIPTHVMVYTKRMQVRARLKLEQWNGNA